ncbi:unnamed protein product [Sphenostylis stenocarpa]|uniref:Cellulose synthase-like protein E1 n=1 Tax=Sphenostylis stenocarpa TaxID=92480 RepID=A0AA86SSY3_9FABA|nr:unnamed protein product [Sphenostylis stenocarpa]
MAEEENSPLFEIKRAKGRVFYKVLCLSLFVGICFIWVFRVSHMPREGEDGRWGWIGMFCVELWFGLYWLLRHSLRWNLLFREPFRDRLSQRYEKVLPKVDIFVCTADPVIEPAVMVINTVLSVMAYDYPPDKLSVYLSDDAASDITFYALFEASIFAKQWLPFCRKFKVDPTSPAAYFKTIASSTHSSSHAKELLTIKKLYQDMESRIENAGKMERVPEELHSKHKGFSAWDSYYSRPDHDTILQILLDGKDSSAKDVDGNVMPILVYLAREKRPQVPHDFKAGAMNSLIRVSSMISNGEIILNTPQCFENITKNDVYGCALRVVYEVELHGADSLGGPMYIGTGCFHRREILCGRKFSDQYKKDWNECKNIDHMKEASLHELEEKSKALASCTYDKNTLWGKEMGLQYANSIEDLMTGLSIKCRGWKSAYYNPRRSAFLGVAPTTLPQASKWHTVTITYGCFFPGQLYITASSLHSISSKAFPCFHRYEFDTLAAQMSSPWFIPFAYVMLGDSSYCPMEFLWSGGTVKGWWNDLRMWLYKRTSSYLFASVDTIMKLFGFSESTFVVSAKVAEENVSQ